MKNLNFLFTVTIMWLLFSCTEQELGNQSIKPISKIDVSSVEKFPKLKGRYIDKDLLNVNKIKTQVFLALRSKDKTELNEEAKAILEEFNSLDIEDGKTGKKINIKDFNDKELKIFLNFFILSGASFDNRDDYERTLDPKYVVGLSKALDKNVAPLFDNNDAVMYNSMSESLLSRLEDVSADMAAVESEIEDAQKETMSVNYYSGGGDYGNDINRPGLSNFINCLERQIDHPGYIIIQNIVAGNGVGKHAALFSRTGFENKQRIIDTYHRLKSNNHSDAVYNFLNNGEDYSPTISITRGKSVYNEPVGVWARKSMFMPVYILTIGRTKWKWNWFKSGYRFTEISKSEYDKVAMEAEKRLNKSTYNLCPNRWAQAVYNCSTIVFRCVHDATGVNLTRPLWVINTICYNPNSILMSRQTRKKYSW